MRERIKYTFIMKRKKFFIFTRSTIKIELKSICEYFQSI